MSVAVLQNVLEAVACPTCYSKMLLTKEQILICQTCLLGFKVLGEVPDLRLENAINFKMTPSQKNQEGLTALFTVISKEQKNQTFEVKLSHCKFICKTPLADFEGDTTFVGKLSEEISHTRIPLDLKSMRLIEPVFLKASQSLDKAFLQNPNTKEFLGFARDVDFLIQDSKISKTHAVLFQNLEGVYLMDLVSDLGTYVNAKEVEFVKLKSNDVISLGSLSLRVNFI